MSKNIHDKNDPGTAESLPPMYDGCSQGSVCINSGQESGQPRKIDFSNELISLLKSQPGYSIWLTDFGYRYEQHFGKRFNVKEHGYTTLKNLFKALQHLVSFINEDNSCIAIKLNPVKVSGVNHEETPADAMLELQEIGRRERHLYETFSMRHWHKALIFCRDLTMLLNSRPRWQGGLSIIEFKAIYQNHFGNDYNFELTIGLYRLMRYKGRGSEVRGTR